MAEPEINVEMVEPARKRRARARAAATPKPYVAVERNRTWRNWHDSADVGGKVQRFYTPRNIWSDGSIPGTRRFEPGLHALQAIVRDAEASGKRVRAVGSGWSLSSAAFVEDYLVNTAYMDYWFIGFATPTMVEEPFRGRRDRLVFAQCGVQIKTLNAYLEQRRLVLPTSGASNGQTIVGAMSTGTHGSANQVGSIQDCILGVHVVAEGGEHYWIERGSRPVVAPAFCDWLGAKQIRDDDLFHAVVVGFGSFGLVHGVLFEAEPLYLLGLFIKQCDYADAERAARTLDLSGLGLPEGNRLPFHFEIIFNPYRRGRGEGGAFVRVLYKRPMTKSFPPPPISDGQLLRSQDLVCIGAHFSDVIPGLIPSILQSTLETSGVPPTRGKVVLGTPGQMFGDSSPTHGGTSMEIGVSLDRVGDALDALFSVTDQHQFGAPVALRYVKASEALLAFTHFSPLTCTIELPGIDSTRSRAAHQLIFRALQERGIPHTYHWGQALPLNASWATAGFGHNRVRRWLAARSRFLSPAGRRMFSNPLLDACGLSDAARPVKTAAKSATKTAVKATKKKVAKRVAKKAAKKRNSKAT